MNQDKNMNFVKSYWHDAIIPSLSEFVKIPCKSQDFDPDWQKNGYLEKAAVLIADWAKKQGITGLKAEVLKIPDRVPTLFVEIPGEINETVMFYGHIDKMPESTGWEPGLDPWQPVVRGDKLYGRGTVDDGYAPYAAIAAIKALQEQKIPHARCVLFIESGEESGSPHFAEYLDKYRDRIGKPSLIVVLDSDGADYERFWRTISLRGCFSGILDIEIVKQGLHSGGVSGIVPSTFRIMRQLLDRIENKETGEVLLKSANIDIPAVYVEQARKTREIIGKSIYTNIPWVAGAAPVSFDLLTLILNNTWRQTISITGADGIPAIKDAGNVLRPNTKLKVSVRIPPRTKAVDVVKELKEKLEENPPYGASIKFNVAVDPMAGWDGLSDKANWLDNAIFEGSQLYFGKEPAGHGIGGSIGTITTMADRFPDAQLLLAGAGAPDSGAHGPDEFLHIPTAEKITCCIAHILAAQGKK